MLLSLGKPSKASKTSDDSGEAGSNGTVVLPPTPLYIEPATGLRAAAQYRVLSACHQRPIRISADAAAMDAYAMVAAERIELADTLDELGLPEAGTASLCRGWTVQDVAAHVVMVLEVSAAEFLKTFFRCRGSFDRANDRLTQRWSSRGLPALSAALRQHADSTFAPPGAGPEATLADTVVHGIDIREPLGIEREVPPDALLTSLQFLVNLVLPPGQPGPTLVPRRLLDGLCLAADDLDFAHGAGRRVNGNAQDLLLAITGRASGARRLTGPGAGTLLGRLATARR